MCLLTGHWMVFEHPHRTQRCQRSCWLRENFKDSCGWRATERGPKDQFVADTARKRHLQAHGRQIPAHSLPGLEADSVVAGPQPFWYFFACSEPPELRFLGRWYFLSSFFSTQMTIQRKIRNICPFLGGPLPPFFPFHPWVYKIANLKRSRFCRSAGVPWRELTDVSALHVLPSGFRPSGNGQRGGVGLRFFCDCLGMQRLRENKYQKIYTSITSIPAWKTKLATWTPQSAKVLSTSHCWKAFLLTLGS